jgi:hypothetical protein
MRRRIGVSPVRPADAMGGPDVRACVWLWASALLTLVALGAGAVLAPPSSAPPAGALTWLLFLGSSVHVAATGSLFTARDVRAHAKAHRDRYVFAPLCLVLVAAILAGVLRPTQMAWILLPYFGWQFLHFQRQNVGMIALATKALDLKGPGPADRAPLLLSAGVGTVGLVAHPALLQLQLATHVGALFGPAFGLNIVALAAGVRALAQRHPDDRRPGYCVVYLSSLCFFLPIFLFRSPYAAVAGMTIAHGVQYLLLVGLIAGSRGQGTGRAFAIAAFANIALVGGVALTIASHLHDGPTGQRLLFGVYLGLVMAHFVVDGGLWRLRDPFPRAFLSARIPYLVPPAVLSVADRSVADIQ